eukprot:SAG31_NODE_16257_length_716_cov_1.476499_1_plen_238_part_11
MLAEMTWKPSWSVYDALAKYMHVRLHVSAKCRLTQAEEWSLLQMVSADNQVVIENRRSFLDAVRSAQDDDTSIICPLRYPEVPCGNHMFFEGGHDDYAWLRRTVGKTFADLCLSGYNRPDPISISATGSDALCGLEALDILHKWLQTGLRIRPGKLKLGFLLFYEMMTGTLPISILRTDSPRTLAQVLLLTLPAEDVQHSAHASLLRLLSSHDSISLRAPKYTHEPWSLSTVFAGTER